MIIAGNGITACNALRDDDYHQRLMLNARQHFCSVNMRSHRVSNTSNVVGNGTVEKITESNAD